MPVRLPRCAFFFMRSLEVRDYVELTGKKAKTIPFERLGSLSMVFVFGSKSVLVDR